jgi:hypothetical protein
MPSWRRHPSRYAQLEGSGIMDMQSCSLRGAEEKPEYKDEA